MAIAGLALARRHQGDHLVTQRSEHPAVLESCRALSQMFGLSVTVLDVDATGMVDPADLESAIAPRTVLVSIMHANNETGTVQPVRELAAIARRRGVAFHTDAAQTVGKVPVAVGDLDVDAMTIVGHKIYGPKGIGALYLRSGVEVEPISFGGGRERGLRAGTENVAHIVGIGRACSLVGAAHVTDSNRLGSLRDLLHQRLRDLLGDRLRLNGHPTERLPNTLNVSIDGVDSNLLLDCTPEIAASTGSACHSGGREPSSVLLAMGQDPDRARSALRLSVGRWSTEQEVCLAADAIARSVTELRRR